MIAEKSYCPDGLDVLECMPNWPISNVISDDDGSCGFCTRCELKAVNYKDQLTGHITTIGIMNSQIIYRQVHETTAIS